MSVMESTQIQASQGQKVEGVEGDEVATDMQNIFVGTGTVTESGENVQEYRREFKNEQPMDSHHFAFPLKEEQNFTGEPPSQTTQKVSPVHKVFLDFLALLLFNQSYKI